MILEFEDQVRMKHPKCSYCKAKFASSYGGLCYNCRNQLRSEGILREYFIITGWACNNYDRTGCNKPRTHNNILCPHCQL